MYTAQQKKEHIRELQTFLHRIACAGADIPRIIPDGIYSASTEQAVRAFQRSYGLTETGEVNQATWEKLAEANKALTLTQPEALSVFDSCRSARLRRGDSSFSVSIVQVILRSLATRFNNLPMPEITGTFDTATVQAMQHFQRHCSLPVTGELDCQSWNMLVSSVQSTIRCSK